MPRVSQKVAQETRRRIIRTAFKMILDEGFESLTFTNIAKCAKISRSGINAHFKKKEDLIHEIEPLMVNLIVTRLDFTSASNFWSSWVDQVDNAKDFQNVILCSIEFSYNKTGFNNLINAIQGDKEECTKVAYQAVGYAQIHLNSVE